MSKKDSKDAKEKDKGKKPEAEEPVEGEEGEAPKPSKKKKIIIIAVAAILLLGGGGAGLYFSGVLGGKTDPKKDAAHGEKDAKAKEAEKAEPPTYIDLPEFLVNLNTGGRAVSFLKMTVTLEVKKAEYESKIEEQMPRIVDVFNTYLRELKAEDLQGSAGIFRLREELMLRLNKTLKDVKVEDILFKEIIVQ